MPVHVGVLSFSLMYLIFRICSCEEQITPEKTDLKTLEYAVYCKFQPNSVDCTLKGGVNRYYFDLKLEDCKPFSYGFCPTAFNNFESFNTCWETCRDEGLAKVASNLTDNVACRLQPDFGDCHDYFPMWYFDINARVCKGFSYSGCGGNQNRFATSQICTATCPKITEY